MMYKKTYSIKGMHCPACETYIEQSVRRLKGINNVKVSLPNTRIMIEAISRQAIPSLHKLNHLFIKNGYSFSGYQQKPNLQPKDLISIVGIFTLIVILFFLFERSHRFSFLYLNTNSNLFAFILFGIAAGFSSCAALVGSMLLSVQGSWVNNRDSLDNRGFIPFLLFNSARIVSFAILGGLLGRLGGIVQFSLEATAILTILISVLILIIGMQMLGVTLFQRISLNFTGRWVGSATTKPLLQKKLMPVLFGMITFFVPCGFTLIAQSQALGSGSFIDGMTILLAFSLGTLPVLLVISFSSIKFYRDPRFSNSFRVLSGLLIVFFAVYTIGSQLRMLDPSITRNVIAPGVVLPYEMDNGKDQDLASESQLMQMEARGFEYFPEVITIKAHLPTQFEIYRDGSLGCANAVYARGLYPDVIFLDPGLNVVEFIAPVAGTYQVSCSMWMVNPITVVVE